MKRVLLAMALILCLSTTADAGFFFGFSPFGFRRAVVVQQPVFVQQPFVNRGFAFQRQRVFIPQRQRVFFSPQPVFLNQGFGGYGVQSFGVQGFGHCGW